MDASVLSPAATMGGRSTLLSGVREKSKCSGMVAMSSAKLDTASKHCSKLEHRVDYSIEKLHTYMQVSYINLQCIQINTQLYTYHFPVYN